MLGNGSWDIGDSSAVPASVTGLQDIVSIAAGFSHSLAVREDGTVWSWGNNRQGQLGNGEGGGVFGNAVPEQVVEITKAVSVGAGDDYSIAVMQDGTLRAWGENGYGMLGDGTTEERWIPVSVEGIDSVRAVDGSWVRISAHREREDRPIVNT